MELQEMEAEDIVEPCSLDSYRKDRRAVYWELLRLNNNLFVLDKISAFPFHLFGAGYLPLFWRSVSNALFETSVLTLWTLAADTDPRTLTIQRFKNSVLRALRQDIHRQGLQGALRETTFDRTLSGVRERLRKARNTYIAHFNRDWNIEPTREDLKQRTLHLRELTQITDDLNSVFRLLCFGDWPKCDFEYPADTKANGASDYRTDIEALLDMMVRNSPMLRLPEEHPEAWARYARDMPPEELQVFNWYRSRLGLPEV